MIYKFRSKAAGDTLMLGPHGDRFLRAIGREPSPQGIIEVAAMAGALAALQRAIEQDEAARQASSEQEVQPGPTDQDPVGLRQRLWPMVEMIRRARAAEEPVVWGV